MPKIEIGGPATTDETSDYLMQVLLNKERSLYEAEAVIRGHQNRINELHRSAEATEQVNNQIVGSSLQRIADLENAIKDDATRIAELSRQLKESGERIRRLVDAGTELREAADMFLTVDRRLKDSPEGAKLFALINKTDTTDLFTSIPF